MRLIHYFVFFLGFLLFRVDFKYFRESSVTVRESALFSVWWSKNTHNLRSSSLKGNADLNKRFWGQFFFWDLLKIVQNREISKGYTLWPLFGQIINYFLFNFNLFVLKESVVLKGSYPVPVVTGYFGTQIVFWYFTL